MIDKLITSDEARDSLYFLEITADMVVFDKNKKIVESYISQQEALEAKHEALKKDVARYFDNLKVIDDYKHSHPNETNKELEISLEKEVALYRELFAKLRKVGKEE